MKKFLGIALAALTLTGSVNPASANPPSVTGKFIEIDGDGRIFLGVDVGSLRKNGSTRSFWLLVNRVDEINNVNPSLMLIENLNCTSFRGTLVQSIETKDGAPIIRQINLTIDWKNSPLYYQVFAKICKI